MKLKLKLIAAAVTGIALVLTVATWADVQDERDALIADAAHDHSFFARQMRAYVAAVWALDGEEAALQMLRTANALDRPFDTTVISYTGQTGDVRRPMVPAAELGGLARGEEVTVVRNGFIYSYSPLAVPGRPGLAVQLVEGVEHPAAESLRFDLAHQVIYNVKNVFDIGLRKIISIRPIWRSVRPCR